MLTGLSLLSAGSATASRISRESRIGGFCNDAQMKFHGVLHFSSEANKDAAKKRTVPRPVGQYFAHSLLEVVGCCKFGVAYLSWRCLVSELF